MGSRLSKIDSQQHLQAVGHIAVLPAQDDDPLNGLFKPELLASTVPSYLSLNESSYGSFPSELPERPHKPSRFSFTKRKTSLSTLTSPSTPAISHLSPVSDSDCDLTHNKRPELKPYRSTDQISTLPTLPSSSSLIARPRRKPLPASNAPNNLKSAISSPTLSTPKKELDARTLGSGLSPGKNSFPALDLAPDLSTLQIARLNLGPSGSTLTQEHNPASPSSLIVKEEVEIDLFASVLDSNMMGPIRKSRRPLKESPQSSNAQGATTRMQTKKWTRPIESEKIYDVSLDYDSQNTPPRKSRSRGLPMGSLITEHANVSHPDMAVGASEDIRNRRVTTLAYSVIENEPDQDNKVGNSIERPQRLRMPASARTMNEDEWENMLVTRQLQQAQYDVLLDDDGLPVLRRPPKGTKRSRNRSVSTDKQTRTSPWESGKRGAEGTKDDPIAVSSESETDSMFARRLEREDHDHVMESSQRSRQQQEADAAVARKLEQELKEEDEREQVRIEEEERNRLRREEEERERQRYRDCAVCGENVFRADFPSLAYCTHEPETCAECYAGWITSEIKDGSWREIRCPGNKCKVVLENHEIQQFATSEDFDQLGNLLLRDALSTDPNFRWCRGPGCQSGHVHEGGNDDNIWRCGDCGFRVCVIHDNTWHEGETCTEYDYRVSGQKEKDEQKRKEQEEASVKAIGKMSKKCPGKECGWNIQKNDGCDHMTCSKCRHEFCWICLAPYDAIRSTGNAAHNDDCKYHTSKIR